MKKIAWQCVSEKGHRVVVSLTIGKPEGELAIILPNGEVWTSVMDLNEIALFAASEETGDEDLVNAYLDEMVLNAEAIYPQRVH